MEESRIAQQRKKLGLSQEQLANKVGVTQKSISKYERGISHPSYETISMMSKLFHVSVDYLVGNDDRPNSSTNNGYFFFFFDDILKLTFQSRLKKRIRQLELSDEDFMEKTGFDAETFSMYINAECEPSIEDLVKISQALNTSIDYLLGQIPQLEWREKSLLNAFCKLSDDNKDIIIGETKKTLRDQEKTDFIFSDEDSNDQKMAK